MLSKKRVLGNRGKAGIDPPQFTIIDSIYLVKVAKGEQEVREALQLRYEVFRKELQKGVSRVGYEGVEMDQYDTQCYHLIVRHRKSGKVVDTYRLQSWEMAKSGVGFYTVNQFEISGIPGPFLKQSIEIGRDCIHKDYRNGRVLFMLWKGLAASLISMGKTTLFGRCSLYSRNQDEGLFLMNSLIEKSMLLKA